MDSFKKNYPITNDYDLYEDEVLGLGKSGYVILCIHKVSLEKCALKVNTNLIEVHEI